MNRNNDRNDNDDFDSLLRDFRTASPQQRDLVLRRVIGRARTDRARAIRDLFRGIYDWMRRRAAIARLRRLDDRMLKDIGINRGEIESAVLGFPADRTRRSAPSSGSNRAIMREIDKAA
jgi:uncharacterized protein YjiS (DUF1127 family)